MKKKEEKFPSPDKRENAKYSPDSNPNVDLCIMLDCTGSMGEYIEISRTKIKTIIANILEVYPSSQVRLSIVAYRDIEDDNRFEIFPFSECISKAKTFLENLHATGGGDAPEDINGAFQKALFSLTWLNPVRLLVHVADAPCHGSNFHDSNDDYPNGYKQDMKWENIFAKMVREEINYLFLKIFNETDKMFKLFKEIAIAQEVEENEIDFTQEEVGDSRPNNIPLAEHFAAKISDQVKVCLEKELKKCFVKKLEKRMVQNENLVTDVRQTVRKLVKELDVKALHEKYKGLSMKIGRCILSTNNFIEALADEDCLCLSFDIGRSQAAIVDPSQIIIKDVYPSFITAGSFFESTKFALKKNSLAHGGYQKNAEGLIIKGAAQENITGVMPLFLCEENWKVAKKIMKLTMAWNVTLETTGYTYSQIKIVPFLVLAKLAQKLSQKQSEFLKFQFDLVRETCVQIMKEGSRKEFENRFDNDTLDVFYKYVLDPSVRTVDVIPNNTCFLAQLYIVKELEGDLKKDANYFDEFSKTLIEEELRRVTYPLEEDINFNQWLHRIMNVNVKKYILPAVENYVETNKKERKTFNYYEDLFKEISTKSVVKESNEEEFKANINYNLPSAIPEADLQTSNRFNLFQKNAKDEYISKLARVSNYIYPLLKLITGKEVNSPHKFSSWGINDFNKFFALYIQNKMQTKNSDRREAFFKKEYLNPWSQSKELLRYWYEKSIRDEIRTRINMSVCFWKSADIDQRVKIFAYSDNLDEAAGALMGTRIGSGDIKKFHSELCDGQAIYLKQKVEILLRGTYKNVRMYTDLWGWPMSKKKMNALYRAYNVCTSKSKVKI